MHVASHGLRHIWLINRQQQRTKFMPLRKQTPRKVQSKKEKASPSRPFPPEAYDYDSDITDEVTKRVQSEADKILRKDKWTVIDGVDNKR